MEMVSHILISCVWLGYFVTRNYISNKITNVQGMIFSKPFQLLGFT